MLFKEIPSDRYSMATKSVAREIHTKILNEEDYFFMRSSRHYISGIVLIIILFLPSCSLKKESQQIQINTKKQDSLLEKAERLLRQDSLASLQNVPAVRAEAKRSTVQEEKNEAPRLPETPPQVDVAVWSGMTFQRLDHLLSELSRTNPPSIQYYGICNKIVFTFADNRPAAKLKEITCFLDNAYKIRTALEVLGFAVVKEENIKTNTYVESAVSNQGIKRVRSMLFTPKDLTTKKIIVTYE